MKKLLILSYMMMLLDYINCGCIQVTLLAKITPSMASSMEDLQNYINKDKLFRTLQLRFREDKSSGDQLFSDLFVCNN